MMISERMTCCRLAGGACRFSVWAAGVPLCGSDPLLEDAETPGAGTPPTGGRGAGPLPGRPAAVDRQLRSHIRIPLRFFTLLRPAALRIIRNVRQGDESHPDMGVPLHRRCPVCRPAYPVLRASHLRVFVL